MGREVLLVDDEEVFADLTREQLARRGFTVRVAGSGEEALKSAKASPPDAIVLDILMPGMDGVELLKRLKSDPATSGIPVIVCSITTRSRARIQSLLQMGASDYINKPCEPDDLVARLNRALGGG